MSKSPIILDENFRLDPDGYQWILRYESKRTEIDPDTLLEKVVTSSDQWYHGEIRFALRAYCDKVLKPEPTVAALLNKIEELVVKIDGLYAFQKSVTEPMKRKKVNFSPVVDKEITADFTELEARTSEFLGARKRSDLYSENPDELYPTTIEEAFPDPLADLY